MEEKEHNGEHEGEVATEMKEQGETPKESQGAKTPPPSYKQSLMGYNGIANGGKYMESEDFITDDGEVYWQLPEPSEEVKKMIQVYPVVPISPEEFNEWCKPWNYTLIITVLGKRFNLFLLKNHLIRIWGTPDFELIDIPNNYFVVKFTNPDLWKEHYKKVLYGGPWVIAQHYVLVQRWSPYFNPFKNQFRRIVTWVCIPHIPLHCYSSHCITRMGERIGKPLRVDMHTRSERSSSELKVERGRYARICLELDLQKQLVPRIIAANEIFNVEYEGLNLICFECGRYGHRKEACLWKKSVQNLHEQQQSQCPQAAPPEKIPAKKTPEPEEPFGPWMLVSRPVKPRLSRRGEQTVGRRGAEGNVKEFRREEQEVHRTRFTALTHVEEEEDDDADNKHIEPSKEQGMVTTDVFRVGGPNTRQWRVTDRRGNGPVNSRNDEPSKSE